MLNDINIHIKSTVTLTPHTLELEDGRRFRLLGGNLLQEKSGKGLIFCAYII